MTTSSRRQMSPGMQCTRRWQVRQRSGWFARISDITDWRACFTTGVSVRTTMPSATTAVQESCIEVGRPPSISTRQVRQPAYGSRPSM